MACPRCQHENAARMKFCGECGTPLTVASSTARSYADLKREVERLGGALTEALEQHTATAELLQAGNRELAEAQEQQTATAEILRVISSAPTHLQAVLDTVAESATRLCKSSDAEIFRREGDRLVKVAHHGPIPSGPIGEFTIPLVRGTANGRSVLDERTVHVADLQAEVDEFPEGSAVARRLGHRTNLSVPLMREGVAIGTICLRRTEVELFTERQVAMLQIFADQAVIAIENVRLFNETKEALEQQTATAEILRVISSSPTDVQPVFDAIAERAMRLCGASSGAVTKFDGELIHLAALANVSPEAAATARSLFPMPPSRGGAVAGRS